MRPVSEEAARIALKRFKPQPVKVYVTELRQLPSVVDEDSENDVDADYDDDEF